jgi:hypothetical protein
MGRRRQENSTHEKNNSIEDLVGNEDNEYPVPDPNRTLINTTNDLSDIHKKSPKEKIMDKLIEILMEKLQDTVK